MKNKLIDMLGQKFNRLTVLRRYINHKKDGNTYWTCQCTCGNTCIVSRQSLITKNTQSCGCIQKEKMGDKYIDLTNKVFGKLTVLNKSKNKSSYGHILWICQCSCGNKKEISGISLRAGVVKSCGCLHTEKMKQKTLPDFGSGKNKLYQQYRTKALNKGKSFVLTKEYFLSLTQQNCHYCGGKPNSEIRCKPNSLAYVYNGIDRIDNTKGYNHKNCVPCCSTCNYAKRTMTHSQFLEWVLLVYNHSINLHS